MKKFADFLVNRRIMLLISIIVIAAVCGGLATTLKTNTDMAEYLPESSEMKQGLEIMNRYFPADESTSSIRVMFDGLNDEQIKEILEDLKSIDNVSGVDYEAGNGDYNNGSYTLFVVHTRFDYDTPEEAAIEKALAERFGSYSMVFQNNGVQSSKVTPVLLLSALGIALIILVIMSRSWLEPVLFMATIGIAVLINLGTNIIFPYTSDLTSSVGPIIQLVLSMDYSIILMNRYRLEKLSYPDRTDAMKAALKNSFSSIASSSLTTVVGLLALVFLSFRIGAELGIILAKGVLISMICVYAVLPALILTFDKQIEKSEKKSPRIPMGGFAKFSHKVRFVMPFVFIVLFVASFFVQRNTGITFTEGLSDPMSDVFPKTNTVVLVYGNYDEINIDKVIAGIEGDNKIKSIVSYTNTLGKKMNAEEMTDAVGEFGSEIDAELVRTVYFLSSGADMPSLTPRQFIDFIRNDVLANPAFSGKFDSSVTEQLDKAEKFLDKDTLLRGMSASEAAEFFGLDVKDANSLYLLYFTLNGNVDYGTMTIGEFTSFILDTVANDQTYSSMINESSLGQLRAMRVFTDGAKMLKKRNYTDAAAILGTDSESMKLIYVYGFAQNKTYTPPKMTLAEFVGFVVNDVAKNPLFSKMIDEEALSRLNTLAPLTDKKTLTTPLPPSALANILGVEETAIQGVFYLSGNTTGTMSVQETVDFMLSNETVMQSLDAATAAKLGTLRQIIQLVLGDVAMSYDGISSLAGMNVSDAKMLFTYRDAQSGGFGKKNYLSVHELIGFIADNEKVFSPFVGDGFEKIGTLRLITSAAVSGTMLPPSDVASLTGMDEKDAKALYLLRLSFAGDTAEWMLSPMQFIDFAVNTVSKDDAYKDYFDENTSNDLKAGKLLADAVISGAEYNSSEMSTLFGSLSSSVSASDIGLVYVLFGGKNADDSGQSMTIPEFIGYVCDKVAADVRFESFFDEKSLSDLTAAKNEINDAVLQMKGDKYSRVVITSEYPDESKETTEFMKKLDALRTEHLGSSSYLIGSSAMVYEMNNGFSSELLIITLITAVSVFLVVLLAFRNLIVPAVLTLLVQCGVYITVAIVGINGGTMYYLALLIVQSILMGATIDYGIVFSDQYRESRQSMDRPESLKTAYENSIHTVMTSGSILILVTGILGVFSPGEVISQVCLTISIGSLVAVLLILTVLPSILDFCDRLIVRKLR